MIYINIISKRLNLQMIPNFATELETPDDIMEQQEDINKLVEWANKWQQKSFNVNKYMFCDAHRTQQHAKKL